MQTLRDRRDERVEVTPDMIVKVKPGKAYGVRAGVMRAKPRGGRGGKANIATAVSKAMHRRREDLKSNWGIIK